MCEHKTIPVQEAVGHVLAHDITEIRRGRFKGAAFRRGHVVRPEDVEHLRDLGKEHLYVLEVGEDELHEDDAVRLLAEALAGPGVVLSGEPREGRINFLAARDGLFRVKVEALLAFNLLGEVMCATLHTHRFVRAGKVLGGTRPIPLVIRRQVVEEAVRIARDAGGILQVQPLPSRQVGVVITGNEVYHGRIQDGFAPVLRKKIADLGSTIAGIAYAPDRVDAIRREMEHLLLTGAECLVLTGGMSVDPDDVTRQAIRDMGTRDIAYGAAVLPGAMFLVGYLSTSRGEVPVVGVPACALYHAATVFDLVFPRILSGERVGRRELAALGHGGLCEDCPTCHFPACAYGKG